MCIFNVFFDNRLSQTPLTESLEGLQPILRTSEEVRAEFKRKGISISQWAIANAFPPNLVYDVLAERRNPTRGQTHRIAVTLGLKDGEIVNDQELATAIGA
ncbi:DNA-binding protein [Pseudodesulfovibrio sp. JC047]|uniref:DNA-binding protein n=1 Tax=Pseudodesulfovibrio sp. JC047 TaxID=2683199 RepID=UPI0013CF4B6D|nr:DNA-binding protein [Pseudodesulfovibrio sp. JC047]NDV20943.1 DNA-binding protein [Pseudodesulfovibrio sp. JC047]